MRAVACKGQASGRGTATLASASLPACSPRPHRESPAALPELSGEQERHHVPLQSLSRIGKIEELKADAPHLDRRSDRWPKAATANTPRLNGFAASSFDADLNAEMLTQLDKAIRYLRRPHRSDRLAQRRAEDHDNTFEITRYQRLSRPKTKSASAKTKADETDAAA